MRRSGVRIPSGALYFKNGSLIMTLSIIRLEKRIVTCMLEDGTIIDIARRWFTDDIEEGDVIEFDVEKKIE